MSGEHRWYFSICAIIKNEGPYLAEWIEYHRLVGVDHFFIYDNGSADQTLRVLKPYIRDGIVDYSTWPDYPGQLSAYWDCIEKYKNESFWIGFLDLDEFLVPLVSQTVPEFLRGFERGNGLGVNWVVYGPSGHERMPPGLQIESYFERSLDHHPMNLHIKSISNPRRISGVGVNPHYFVYQDGGAVVDEDGQEILTGAYSRTHKSAKMRINHYVTRSKEEFRKKILRGRATTPVPRPFTLASDEYYEGLSERADHLMLKYVARVQQGIRDRDVDLRSWLKRALILFKPGKK